MGNIPAKDLDFISRIYVVTREKINAAGTYTPQINAIALLWDNAYKDKSALFWFFPLFTEKILYHEIGHHKHHHKFGTDPDQEKEADRYAYKIMKKIHPFFLHFARPNIILKGLGLYSKKRLITRNNDK